MNFLYTPFLCKTQSVMGTEEGAERLRDQLHTLRAKGKKAQVFLYRSAMSRMGPCLSISPFSISLHPDAPDRYVD